MSVGDQDHGGVAMAVAIAFGGLGQALHLVVGQILACPQIGVFRPNRHHNCSLFDGWQRGFQGCFGHVLHSV